MHVGYFRCFVLLLLLSIALADDSSSSHPTQVAVKHDIPIILHSRKAEKRVFEMLKEEGVVKADFHCYCGKVSSELLDCVVLAWLSMMLIVGCAIVCAVTMCAVWVS